MRVIAIKKLNKLVTFIAAIAVTSALMTSVSATDGDYGAQAVREDRTYSLEQMLTYALEDEYLAYARYQADIKKFGEIRPFTNIVKAENRHIELLKPLFEKYGVAVPESRAAEHLTEPETLLDAMKAGVAGETDNMRMYDIFLGQELPNNVRIVFSLLKSAAAKHLEAFKRNVAHIEQGAPGRNFQ